MMVGHFLIQRQRHTAQVKHPAVVRIPPCQPLQGRLRAQIRCALRQYLRVLEKAVSDVGIAASVFEIKHMLERRHLAPPRKVAVRDLMRVAQICVRQEFEPELRRILAVRCQHFGVCRPERHRQRFACVAVQFVLRRPIAVACLRKCQTAERRRGRTAERRRGRTAQPRRGLERFGIVVNRGLQAVRPFVRNIAPFVAEIVIQPLFAQFIPGNRRRIAQRNRISLRYALRPTARHRKAAVQHVRVAVARYARHAPVFAARHRRAVRVERLHGAAAAYRAGIPA